MSTLINIKPVSVVWFDGTANWCESPNTAPPGVRIVVQDHLSRDMWAVYYPGWGNGRGAWFNDRGQLVPRVRRYQLNSITYAANRPVM